MANFLAQNWLFLVVLVSLGLLAAIIYQWWSDQSLPYQKRDSLLTAAELQFYHVLRAAAGDDWTICAMVRMADLITVRPGTHKPQGWNNRIRSKHLDFVLCDPRSLEAVVAVELDDSSHQRADRVARDEFVEDALDAAGVPLLRVTARAQYDQNKLRELLDACAAQS